MAFCFHSPNNIVLCCVGESKRIEARPGIAYGMLSNINCDHHRYG
jgi:hypothetical protein